MERDRLIEICKQVSLDAANDSKEFDGQPFTGKVVGAYFGYHGAAIAALADVIKEILENNQLKNK